MNQTYDAINQNKLKTFKKERENLAQVLAKWEWLNIGRHLDNVRHYWELKLKLLRCFQKTDLGSVGPQVAVHGAVNGFAMFVIARPPSVVPEASPVVLFFVANNLKQKYVCFFIMEFQCILAFIYRVLQRFDFWFFIWFPHFKNNFAKSFIFVVTEASQ